MSLDVDVPIYVGPGFSRTPVWQVGIGLRRPDPHAGQQYVADAWVPGELHDPTTELVARYVTDALPPVRHGVVGVLEVDLEAVAALQRYLDGARRGSLDEAAGQAALKRLLIAASVVLEIDGNVETRQPHEEVPRQVTVSRVDDADPRTPRVGLHVDHRTATPLIDRMAAPNRLCVNLGPGDRWLLFIPHSIGQLMSAADGVPHGDTKGVLTALADRLPVIRVLTRPGEAYIAPAEAIFHDASTLDSSRPATKLPLMGRFRPRVP